MEYKFVTNDYGYPAQMLNSLDMFVQKSMKNSDYFMIPGHLGEGFIRSRQIQNKMHLTIQSLKLREPMTLDIAKQERNVELFFNLSGCIDVNFTKDRVALRTRPNSRDIYNYDANRTILKFSPGEQYTSVTITFSPDYLRSFLECFRYPEINNTTLDSLNIEKSTIERGLITPEMLAILHRLVNNPMNGLAESVHLESKVLELLALHIDRSSAEHCQNKRPTELQEYDIERIYKAEKILLADIQNPPSLIDLAKQVGLNDFKLKIGFRYIFGNTVFGHLNRHRMEVAKQLLLEQNSNVSDIANVVGYSNPSHFAVSFKKRFGINPGAFRMKTVELIKVRHC